MYIYGLLPEIKHYYYIITETLISATLIVFNLAGGKFIPLYTRV